VNAVVSALFDMGCREVSLGDTIGAGTADSTERLLGILLNTHDARKLAGHFHDTRGQALACVKASLDQGLRVFDASAGGAGGCPFAPGAPGNLPTGALVRFLADEGYEPGIEHGSAGRWLRPSSAPC
jgi:hydroxymethylglutaryl-CoA lyase